MCSSFYFILSAAAKPNLMTFGDCYINEGRSLTLSMTNHSKTDCVRFSWPEHPQLRFSPQVGCCLVTWQVLVGLGLYSDLPCSLDGQKDPEGEILSIHQTCDLELLDTGEVPATLISNVLVVADGLFGLRGLECLGQAVHR